MFYVVQFACYEDDIVETFLLDEETYDSWISVESPESYAYFKIVWKGEISKIYIPESYKENLNVW